jgi:molybdopterin molybdotransferase
MPSEFRPDWVSPAEAREAVLRSVHPLPAERRPLLGALGRVLAEELVSPLDLPPWDNSAMDGFAVRAADVAGASEDDPRELEVLEDVRAGSFPTLALRPGAATRVMTGAPVPEGTDCVIRVEHTDGGRGIGTSGGRVRILSDADAGRNVRSRAEDLRRGERVLLPGAVLRAAEIGVAASMGRSQLSVVRRPVVGILTSGDELVDVDGFAEVLAGRRIVSSNTYALAAQLAESGLEARVLGTAADTPESLREHLRMAQGCDALITSAGISVGEHDFVREVLEEMELEVEFWRVRMRPGSPFAFGRIGRLGGIPWFGLPGNPVSSMVTFELFVRPALLRMSGHERVHAPTVRARLEDDLPGRPGLTHFVRSRLRWESDGSAAAHLTGAQGSNLLTSMSRADALLIVPEERAGAFAGDALTAIVLSGGPLRAEAGY